MRVCCRRYYICDKKLLALGWKEKTSWEEGLAKTIQWYSTVGCKPEYWENGDMNMALVPHPSLQVGWVAGLGEFLPLLECKGCSFAAGGWVGLGFLQSVGLFIGNGNLSVGSCC